MVTLAEAVGQPSLHDGEPGVGEEGGVIELTGEDRDVDAPLVE